MLSFSQAAEGHVDVVMELINAGAAVDIADNDGVTALGAAVIKGSVECVDALINAHADVDHKVRHLFIF